MARRPLQGILPWRAWFPPSRLGPPPQRQNLFPPSSSALAHGPISSPAPITSLSRNLLGSGHRTPCRRVTMWFHITAPTSVLSQVTRRVPHQGPSPLPGPCWALLPDPGQGFLRYTPICSGVWVSNITPEPRPDVHTAMEGPVPLPGEELTGQAIVPPGMAPPASGQLCRAAPALREYRTKDPIKKWPCRGWVYNKPGAAHRRNLSPEQRPWQGGGLSPSWRVATSILLLLGLQGFARRKRAKECEGWKRDTWR